VQPAVGTLGAVVRRELAENGAQVRLVDDDDVIKALVPEGDPTQATPLLSIYDQASVS